MSALPTRRPVAIAAAAIVRLNRGLSIACALQAKLTLRIQHADAAVAQAEHVLGQRHGRASRAALRKAAKSLAAYGKLLRSKKALHALSDETRNALGAPVTDLRAAIGALPTCP